MDKKSISIKTILIISFVVLMLSTIAAIGYLVYSNWMSSTHETLALMAEEMNSRIYREIDDFMRVPLHINEVNQGLIARGTVDVDNPAEREGFFVDVLQTHSSGALYSFSYGTEAGEYYGARRNADNDIEIMRNNLETGGDSWYYSVTEDMRAGELVVQAGKFDPRTRDWYRAAKEQQTLVFSPIYKHFFMDDLTVSAAIPIHDNNGGLQGVLGAHITLSRIDSYLREVTVEKAAMAVIFERESGQLVASSLGLSNFETQEDGTFRRRTIDEIDSQAIIKARVEYVGPGSPGFRVDSGDGRFHVTVTEYRSAGLDWLVMSAIPEDPLIVGILNNIRLTGLLTAAALLLSLVVYSAVTNRFLRPIDSLIATTVKLSQGNLTERVDIVRNDELGRISSAFNRMADTIHSLVHNLEATVSERTAELEDSNLDLRETKDQLQLILDSTAEAVFGLDNDGNCTFCNASCLSMLGYRHQDQLVGQNLHQLIHHSYADGRPMPPAECAITVALRTGVGTNRDDEVFWRADGTNFDVTYHAYPQFRDGRIIGAVITFLDNTERKRSEDHIKYLSYHDPLTGLYNRVFFESELARIDTEENMPISIIFGDANGLKLTNDIFGHAAGDALLKKIADTLTEVCGEGDLVARVGGDEFAILLPAKAANEASEIVNRIEGELSKERIIAVKCSMSLGHATKAAPGESIERTMAIAEAEMYERKTLDRKAINSDLVETITRTLHEKSTWEKRHSHNVSQLCQTVGYAMGMSEPDVRKLRDAGFVHNIGKIVLKDALLSREGLLTADEEQEMQQHPVIGYRILNLFDDTLDLAEGVLNHHERWDGSGYPKGIKGKEIPLLARIIAIAEAYGSMISRSPQHAISQESALQQIRALSGSKFDPEIARVFVATLQAE